jgi:hypothetical protein
MSEQPLKFVGPGHIVIIEEGGKQQAFAKSPGSDEQQIFPLFQQRDAAGPITVKKTLCDNFFEIADTIREFHGMPS